MHIARTLGAIIAIAACSWTAPARAERLYGGFSIGTGLMEVTDSPSGIGFSLSGKIGGRGDGWGGYARLRGSAVSIDGVTLTCSQLAGGWDIFVPGDSSLFLEFGGSWVSASQSGVSVDAGSGPFIGLGFNLLVAEPFNLTIRYDHSFMHPSYALASAGVGDFSFNVLGVEALFQW